MSYHDTNIPIQKYPFVFTLERTNQPVWFRARTAQDDFSLARFHQFSSAIEPDNYIRHTFTHLHFYLQDSVHDISILEKATIWEILYLLCLIYLVSINQELIYEEKVTNEELIESGVSGILEISEKKNLKPSITSKTKIQIHELCSLLVFFQKNEFKIKDFIQPAQNSEFIEAFKWPSYERLIYEIIQEKISPVHIQNKKILFTECQTIKFNSPSSPFFYIPLSILSKTNTTEKNLFFLKNISFIQEAFLNFYQTLFLEELKKNIIWQTIIDKGFIIDYTKYSFYNILVIWYLSLFLTTENSLFEEQYLFQQYNWTEEQFLQSSTKDRFQWVHFIQKHNKYNNQTTFKKDQQFERDVFGVKI